MSICNCKTNRNGNTGKLSLLEGGVYSNARFCYLNISTLCIGGGGGGGLTSVDPI